MSPAGLLRAAAREPLVHFAVGGLVIFALHARLAPPAAGRVVVSAAFVEGLARDHQARTGRAPSADELAGLVDRFVDEEILYREAVALGLDRGDPIVRRRLAQKMSFVAEDEALREPTEAELEASLAAHADRYREGPRLSLRHVYFARDRRLDPGAAAAEALAALRAGAAPDTLGDPFLRGNAFAGRTPAELEAVFGGAFREAVERAPRGAWAGPFPSSYGAHLVFVEPLREGAIPALAAVRARVRQDLLDERREAAQKELSKRLRARYRVERR